MSDKKPRFMKAGAAGGAMALTLLGVLPFTDATASAQSANATQPIFYKGKGVGGNNSYSWRYEEDFSFLRDSSKSTDFFDPLKFIAFDDAKQFYVTFSALERLRYDNNQNNTYNLGSQTKAHQMEAYSRKTQVGADVHLGPNFRVYAELINAAVSGRNINANRLTTAWRNDLALSQAFIEAMSDVDLFGTPAKVGIRAGRQGIYLGNGLGFSFPATSSIPVIPEGIRAYLDTGHDRLDLFAGMPSVRRNDGLIRDGDNGHQNFYVAYGSHDFPTFQLLGADAHISDDPFLIFDRSAAGPATGTTRRTVTTTYGIGATAINTITGQEEVYTIGDRLFGNLGNFDFDWTGQLQRGSFGGYSVEAFAVFTDWGYTFRGLPWTPRIGTHADVASGGGDKNSKTTNLFDDQFVRQPYTGEVVNTAPGQTNLYDLAPRIRVQPLSKVSAEFSWTFLWRYSSADAVYGAQGAYTNSVFAATLGKPGSYIGSQPQLDVRWTPIPHVAVDGEIGQMLAGTIIKNAGGQNDTYGFVQVTLQF
jgi:hypothetical protein